MNDSLTAGVIETCVIFSRSS